MNISIDLINSIDVQQVKQTILLLNRVCAVHFGVISSELVLKTLSENANTCSIYTHIKTQETKMIDNYRKLLIELGALQFNDNYYIFTKPFNSHEFLKQLNQL